MEAGTLPAMGGCGGLGARGAVSGLGLWPLLTRGARMQPGADAAGTDERCRYGRAMPVWAGASGTDGVLPVWMGASSIDGRFQYGWALRAGAGGVRTELVGLGVGSGVL